MKLVNSIKANSLLLVVFVLMCFTGHAQNVTATKDICDNRVLPINLNSVVGLELAAGGGQWYEVSSATAFSADLLDENKVRNMIPAIDRLPGAYYFVFVPKNNPCMDDADRAIVTINILETPLPLSHTIALCPGETFTFDLSSLVSSTLKAMYTNMLYKDHAGNTLSTSTISIGADESGEMFYTYHLNEAGVACTDQADIVLNVVRDGDIAGIDKGSEMAFCLNALPESLNLNEVFKLTVTGGSWSAEGGAPAPNAAGVVDLSGLSAAADYQYKYEYSAGDCFPAGDATFTIQITGDLDPHFNDVEKNICKATSPNGFINLLELIGVGVPNTSGVWTEVEATSPVDIEDGIFELADSRTGKYVYRYTVSNAVSELCGLPGQSATVTINMFDAGEVLDGEVQLCSSALSGEMTLGKYIANLPAGGSWDGGAIIVSATGTISASDLSLGVNMFSYEFDGGPCGSGSANLYVTVTDDITNFTDKQIAYCLTDEGADAIDLDQVLAVHGISGSWAHDAAASTSDQNTSGNWNTTSNVFDGRAAANAETTGEGTYVFTFTASEDGCNINSGDTVTITIKITKDLTM